MAELAELEVNVLEFVRKSFGFSRVASVGGRELAAFHRTETESETQFRPKLLRLHLVVPTEWIVYDLAGDLLLLARDGVHPGPRGTGTAHETAAETREFREQGIDFRRFDVAGGHVYVPAELADEVTAPAVLAELGVPALATSARP